MEPFSLLSSTGVSFDYRSSVERSNAAVIGALRVALGDIRSEKKYAERRVKVL